MIGGTLIPWPSLFGQGYWVHFTSNSWCDVCNFVNADRETCCLQWGGKSPEDALKPLSVVLLSVQLSL